MEYVLKYTDSTGGIYTYKLSDAKVSSPSLCVNTDDGIKYASLTNNSNELDSTQKLRIQYNNDTYGLSTQSEPIVLMPADMTSPTGTLTSDRGSLGLYGTEHGNSEWLTWSTYDKIPSFTKITGLMGNISRKGQRPSESEEGSGDMYQADKYIDHTHYMQYNGMTCDTKTDSASNYSAIGLKAYEKASYIPAGAYIFVKIANTALDNIGTLQAFDKSSSIYINPSSNQFLINSDSSGLPYNLSVSYSFTPTIVVSDGDNVHGVTSGAEIFEGLTGVEGFNTAVWHAHNGSPVTVSLSNRPNILQFKGMTLMVYQLSQNISFNDLPSGSGMFFKTSILPAGWTLDTNQDLPIILGNSYSVINNSSIVTKTSTTAATTTPPKLWKNSDVWMNPAESGTDWYYWKDHTHSIPKVSFNLTTYLSAISYSVGWYLAWKQ